MGLWVLCNPRQDPCQVEARHQCWGEGMQICVPEHPYMPCSGRLLHSGPSWSPPRFRFTVFLPLCGSFSSAAPMDRIEDAMDGTKTKALALLHFICHKWLGLGSRICPILRKACPRQQRICTSCLHLDMGAEHLLGRELVTCISVPLKERHPAGERLCSTSTIQSAICPLLSQASNAPL